MSLSNLVFGSLCLVDLLSGKVCEISTFQSEGSMMNLQIFPLFDCPLCIVKKDQVNFQ